MIFKFILQLFIEKHRLETDVYFASKVVMLTSTAIGRFLVFKRWCCSHNINCSQVQCCLCWRSLFQNESINNPIDVICRIMRIENTFSSRVLSSVKKLLRGWQSKGALKQTQANFINTHTYIYVSDWLKHGSSWNPEILSVFECINESKYWMIICETQTLTSDLVYHNV